MLKLKDNPPVRPQTLTGVCDAEGSWWVAHTKARNEKALAWDLLGRDIAYFLPMVERVSFSGGRKRRGMTPLFSSYLFFAGDRQVRHQVLATNRVANVIEVREQAPLVAELAAIERAIEAGASLTFHPSFEPGQRCRVTQGPMKEVVGTILDAGNVSRILLQVSMLGVGASLEIDGDLLEILD